MPVVIIFVALVASVFGMFYLFITTRNRERMAMIEKGVDLSLFSGDRLPKAVKKNRTGSGLKFSLRTGMFFIGIGVGFVLSVLFRGLVDDDSFVLLVFGSLFVFGGAGLVSGFYLGRNLEQKDEKE